MSDLLRFREIKNFMSTDDLYVCAMGFEDRSLKSNVELQNKNFKAKTILVLQYTNYIRENEKHRSDLEKIWNKMGENFAYVSFNPDRRDAFMRDFSDKFSSLNHPIHSITINMSSMITFPLIWLVNLVLDRVKRIRIIYTEPEGYKNQLEDEQSFASGVKEVFTMKEFAGAALPGYSNLLITFLGYDFVRARGIYEQLQPSRKIGIMAEPNTPKLFDLLQKIEAEHRKSYTSLDKLTRMPLFDMRGMVEYLIKIRDEYIESSNMFVALNGTKIHHISALLFAKKFQDVQLVLSSPNEYFPATYSYGARRTFSLDITEEWIKKFLDADGVGVP